MNSLSLEGSGWSRSCDGEDGEDGEDDDGGLHCEKWTGVKGDCGVGGWILCRKNRLLGSGLREVRALCKY
jgi:hypothetical protein